MNSKLQVAGFLDNTTVNGPGLRSAIFLAGCSHNCKGCQNYAIQDYSAGEQKHVKEIIQAVKYNMPYITGVTLSGGEPFDQDISFLLEQLHNLGLNVWVYTGYTYEQLLEDKRPYIKQALQYINTLVDGKFDNTKTDNAPKYAGSINQRFIELN